MKPFHRVDFKDDKATVEWIRDRWTSRANRRNALESRWLTTIAYFVGLHYARYKTGARHGKGGLSIPSNPDPLARRLIVNRILPAARHAVAFVVRKMPVWKVSPATQDEDDAQRAYAATQVLRSYWNASEMVTQFVDWATWLKLCGNAIFYTGWDENKGPPLDLGAISGALDQGGMDNENAEQIFEILKVALEGGTTPKMGDICHQVVSPFSMEFDPFATKISEAFWCVRSEIRNPEYIYDHWGIKPQSVDIEDADSIHSHLSLVNDLHTPQGGSGDVARLDHDEMSEVVVEHTFHVKPCRKYPNGVYVVTTKDKLLYRGELDTETLPYSHAVNIRVPGKFWGESEFSSAIAVQDDVNDGRTQMAVIRRRHAYPTILEPSGGGTETVPNLFRGTPNERVKFTPPTPPRYMDPPAPTTAIAESINASMNDLDEIVSVRGASKGLNPPGVRSASALNELQKADQSPGTTTLILAEAALADSGVHTLEIFSKRVVVQRRMKIVGNMGTAGAILIGAEDIENKFDAKWDIQVNMGSSLPLGTGERLQVLAELASQRVIDPSPIQDELIDAFQLESELPVGESRRQVRSEIEYEIVQLLKGIPVRRMPWQNGPVAEEHVNKKRLCQMGSLYRRMAAKNQAVHQVFEMNIGEHVVHLQQAQALMTPEASAQAGARTDGGVPANGSGR